MSELSLVGKSSRASVYCGSMADAKLDAEMIACDPPWRQGNLSYWSHKAGVEQCWAEFVANLSRHFSADLVYLKIGVPESIEWISRLRSAGHKRIAWWETGYSSGRNAQIVACRSLSLQNLPMEIESRAAASAVAKWAWDCGVRSAADPCVGNGLMLAKFAKLGMHVTGVELVPSRAEKATARLCLE
jgi:hypothetical protein